jgi:hypothetical protein
MLYMYLFTYISRGRGDRMVVAFTATCAISAYQHYIGEFESRSLQGVLDTTLCDKFCQCLETGWWFSPGTPGSTWLLIQCLRVYIN